MLVLLPSNRLAKPGKKLRFPIAEAFARQGITAEVLDVNAAPRNPFAGKPSLYASIDPWRAATVLLSRRQCGGVISYYQSGALIILALRRAFGFKPPVVIVDIGDDSNWPMRARIVSYCVKRADAVFCLARDQAADLAVRFPGADIRFLPQQVDTDFYAPGGDERGYILSVGDDLSRDYALLQDAVFDLDTPVVLRTDCFKPDPQRPNVVLAPRGTELDLRALYHGARIVVLPLKDMRHPGGISSLLEAFACGKAVVASAARGVIDYLRHEENCLAVPCDDVAALRAAVMRLIEDDGLRLKLGHAARTYAESSLSQDCYARRLAEALTSLRAVRDAP